MIYLKIIICVLLSCTYSTVAKPSEKDRASIAHDLQMVMDKIKAGNAHVHIRDTTTLRTPLHLAARLGSYGDVSYLISQGADPNLRDNVGNTPLHTASVAGTADTSVIEALLAAGADINAANSAGYTPLHFAAMDGLIGNVMTLIDHGADIHKKSFFRNALILAATEGHENVAQLLMKLGAEKDFRYYAFLAADFLYKTKVLRIISIILVASVLFTRCTNRSN